MFFPYLKMLFFWQKVELSINKRTHTFTIYLLSSLKADAERQREERRAEELFRYLKDPITC